MEVRPYYTNFTFEDELRSCQKIQYHKKNTFFEFLFLWIEDSSKTLWSKHTYSQIFLEKIKNLSGSLPEITKDADEPILWWGNSLDPREREINDKLTSFKVRKFLGLDIEDSFIANNENDLKLLKCNSSYLFKDGLGFSGRGQVNCPQKATKLSFPIVVEPRLIRARDIGLTLLNDQDYFCIENFNDDNGQFKGGLLLDEVPEHILIKGRLIFEWYKKKFGVENIQIDMFSYCIEDEMKWNYLCEINHRRTMGWVIWKLKSVFNTNYAAIKIFPKGTSIPESDELIKIIELSPKDHQMSVYFFGAAREKDLKIYLQNFL